MSLTVEDGSGLSDADALISLAYWKTYADALGWAYSPTYSDTQIEQAIRRGSRYVSDAFTFKGVKLLRAQAFAWPRYGVCDADGWPINSDEVPIQVQRAVAEASWRELQSADSLRPDVTMTDRVKSEQVGPLAVTYADASGPNAARPDVKIIRDLLRGLLAAGGGVQLVRS